MTAQDFAAEQPFPKITSQVVSGDIVTVITSNPEIATADYFLFTHRAFPITKMQCHAGFLCCQNATPYAVSYQNADFWVKYINFIQRNLTGCGDIILKTNWKR